MFTAIHSADKVLNEQQILALIELKRLQNESTKIGLNRMGPSYKECIN